MNKDKKFVGNIGWLMGGKIANMVLQFLVTLATARFLGPANFGTINYVAAYVSFFSSIASLGLCVVVIKEISQNPENANCIIWTSIWLRFCVAIVSSVTIVIVMFVSNSNDPSIVKIAFFQSLSIIFSAFDTINYYFQAKLLSKWGSIASFLAYFGMSLYRIYLLTVNASIEWFALASSLDMAILVLFLFVFYVRIEGFQVCFDWEIGKKLLNQSCYHLVAGLITIVFDQVDRVMIGNMVGHSSVGIYSAMLTIATLWSMLPSALIQSAAPILYNTAKANRILYMRRLKQVYAVIFWINAAYSAFVSAFGKWIIQLLYGDAYAGGLIALRIVVWYYGISTLGSLNSIYLVNDRKDKYVNVFGLAGLILDVVLNAVLIPIIGINGAALATLITHVLVQIVLPVLIPATRELAVAIIEGIILKNVITRDEWKALKNLFSGRSRK